MSWLAVNFSLIKKSEIEGTYYFYDPEYPTAIQFLLNGRWEPWAVGYVRAYAKDPDVRRVAEDAEARLYSYWSPVSPTSASTNGYARPPREAGSPALAPSVSPPLYSHPFDGQKSSRGDFDRPGSSLSVSQVQTTTGTKSIPSQSSLSPRVDSHPFSNVPPPIYTSPYASRPATRLLCPSCNKVFSRSVDLAQHQRTHEPPQDGEPLIDTNQALPNSQHSQFLDTPTSPLPPRSIRETKILLSLDGDGVRGLSSVLLVESLMNAICTKLGKHADPYQIFDLMGGVSTTGLFATMIGRMRMPVKKARERYVGLGKDIYANKRDFFASASPDAENNSKQSSEKLEKSIDELVLMECPAADEPFFDTRSNSSNVFVISTKVDKGHNQPALIRSYATRRIAGPDVEGEPTIAQAIRATLMAPRFKEAQEGFDRKTAVEPGLVDYGVSKNSPLRDLVFESRRLFSIHNDTMVIISIGTGLGLSKTVGDHGLLGMANSVEGRNAEAASATEKFEIEHKSLIEQKWIKYFRFNVPGLDTVPLEEWSAIDKIMEKTRAYLSDPEVSSRFYTCVDVVTSTLLGDQNQRSLGPYGSHFGMTEGF